MAHLSDGRHGYFPQRLPALSSWVTTCRVQLTLEAFSPEMASNPGVAAGSRSLPAEHVRIAANENISNRTCMSFVNELSKYIVAVMPLNQCFMIPECVRDAVKTTNTTCKRCSGFVEANQVKQQHRETRCDTLLDCDVKSWSVPMESRMKCGIVEFLITVWKFWHQNINIQK